MNKDLFGFENQGKNYDVFRPKYPKKFIERALSLAKGRKKFLDLGVGTGQILFSLFSNFNSSKGIDKSPKMIQICQQNL